MSTNRERFLFLFEELSATQQQDLLRLMENWASMPNYTKPNQQVPIQPASTFKQNPELTKEWHCLNALKQVVQKHYEPNVELAYIAFHPNLDSISTAKTRAAAETMYQLEAAYELKAIFEKQPELLDEEVVESLQSYLKEQKET